jgi:hypothetical protein
VFEYIFRRICQGSILCLTLEHFVLCFFKVSTRFRTLNLAPHRSTSILEPTITRITRYGKTTANSQEFGMVISIMWNFRNWISIRRNAGATSLP